MNQRYMKTIEELFDDYSRERSLDISLEQFTMFAIFFPSLLVILSDGTLDSEEDLHLKKLSENLANTFMADGLGVKRVEELKEIFVREFEYLIQKIDDWKDAYLTALKNHLKNYPESKETVLDVLHFFAETSEDVDDAENDMIKFLIGRLELEDKNQ